jgi:hypothetical protein
METLDLKRQLKPFYAPPPKNAQIVDVPAFQFIMIDGAIEPAMAPGTSPQFMENSEAMYGAAYTLKFLMKLRPQDAVDYPVMALEGLWDARNAIFDIRTPDNWIYTLMILVPDVITQEAFEEARAQLKQKKGDRPAFARLRLDRFHEGLCVQAMHIGPYATEPETIARMQAFVQEQGFGDQVGAGGKHHEIYMGDPRKAAPEKLKTVLRHPIVRLEA